MRFGRTLRRSIVALLLVGVSTPAWSYEPEVVRSFSRRLTNLQGAISRMSELYSAPLTILAKHDTESRHIDAKVFFDLGHFENASVLLMELESRGLLEGALPLAAILELLADLQVQWDSNLISIEIQWSPLKSY